MRTRQVLLVVGMLALATLSAQAQWLDGWSFRRTLTVDANQIDDDLSDFPLLVRLTPGVVDFGLARADGFDIRFTAADGMSPLVFERERHDAASGTGIYWVRLPLVSSTTDTTFFVYYGNSAAPDGANPSGVWDSDHVAVWHLAQTNGVTQADSTVHANHLTRYGDVAEGEPGITGGGIGLSGSAENPEYLANPPGSFPIIDTTAGLTYSAWAHPTDPPDSWATILNCGGANWPPWWATWFGYSKTSQLRGYSSASVSHGGWGQVVSGFTVDTWKHVVMSVFYDADVSKSTLRLYINGAQVLSHTVAGTNAVTAQSLHNPFAGRPLVVGARTQSTWPANDPGNFFNGWLDEVRVCKVRRSEAWISASYQNQQPDSTLLSFGGIEPATGTMVILR